MCVCVCVCVCICVYQLGDFKIGNISIFCRGREGGTVDLDACFFLSQLQLYRDRKTAQCTFCQTAVKEDWRLAGVQTPSISQLGRERVEEKQEGSVVSGIFLFFAFTSLSRPCRWFEPTVGCTSSLYFSAPSVPPPIISPLSPLPPSLSFTLSLFLSLSLHTKAWGSQWSSGD